MKVCERNSDKAPRITSVVIGGHWASLPFVTRALLDTAMKSRILSLGGGIETLARLSLGAHFTDIQVGRYSLYNTKF